MCIRDSTKKLYSDTLRAMSLSPRKLPLPEVRASRAEAKNGKTLLEFSRDLTAMAREGRLDPVIGREKEIARALRILTRRTKNNPVLIGEPGVGKTAIAEGLAEKIAAGASASRIRNGLSGRSSSSVPREWARRSSVKRSPRRYLAARTR